MLNIYALEQHVEEQMKANHVPGFAFAIIQGHEIIYVRGFGITSVEDSGVPVIPQTLFRVGSITKSLTATAIMRLVEMEKLALDTPVREYLPWFTLSEPGAAEQVTIRMLLSHMSGLPHDHNPFGHGDPETLERRVRQEIPKLPLVVPPGKVYSYSNGAFHILGHIAEVVTGKFYSQVMQELIFDPLEMSRTTFDPTVAMTYSLAQSHDLLEDGTLRVQHRFANNAGHYPSGQAISTVLDLTNFAIIHMHQGRFHDKQLLSPKSIAEMHSMQAKHYLTTRSGYGLGFYVRTEKGIDRVGHSGGINTFGSLLEMVPTAHLAVIAMLNRSTEKFSLGGLAQEILDQMLDLPKSHEKPAPQAIEPDHSLWSQYVGVYLGQWIGLATINIENDQLVLDWHNEVLTLQAQRQDLYFARKPESNRIISVGFISEKEGSAQYVVINGEPCKRYEQDEAFVPDPDSWAACVGTYTGTSNTLTVSLKDGQLFIHSTWFNEEAPCSPLGYTRFTWKHGLIEFHIAEDSTASALTAGNTLTFTRKEDIA